MHARSEIREGRYSKERFGHNCDTVGKQRNADESEELTPRRTNATSRRIQADVTVGSGEYETEQTKSGDVFDLPTKLTAAHHMVSKKLMIGGPDIFGTLPVDQCRDYSDEGGVCRT